jgi:DNA-binding beta-propeller fold protein YncE
VSTATYNSISKSVSSQDSAPYDVAFNSDGSKMYIMGNNNKTVFQYTLSTPWNVSTATYDTSKSVSSQDSAPYGVAFNSDGSKMYIIGASNDTVYQYTVGGTTEYDYVQIDIDIPDDSTKFLDGLGAWRVLTEADISDLGTYLEVNLTSPAKGDILYYDGSNWVNLGIGTSGQVLTVSAGGIPEWATP